MTLIANLVVCALLLSAAAALWVLAHVWMELGLPKLVRGDDPRADTEQDPVVIDSDRVEWYPTKCTNCQGDPDGCMNCREKAEGDWHCFYCDVRYSADVKPHLLGDIRTSLIKVCPECM